MSEIRIGMRLETIASKVRHGVTVIDVGTDHAYIPVYLAQRGSNVKIIASDVAVGPLETAEKNISENGLSDKIETVLSDGLERIDIPDTCDIIIAGMGGELISHIIESKPELRKTGVRLILQPMTKQSYLRQYLCEYGFDITDEDYADEGKIYQIITCNYTGEPYKPDFAELAVGINGKRHENKIFCSLLVKQLDTERTTREAKSKAGIDCSFEDDLIKSLEALKARCEDEFNRTV